MPVRYRTSIPAIRRYLMNIRNSMYQREVTTRATDSPVSRTSAPEIIRRTTGFQE